MEECKRCEMAVYCYTESSTWIFRTKQEMNEKLEAMKECPIHQRVKQEKKGGKRDACAGKETS